MKAIKFRLIVMNFLIFAVWGAYLCSLGIYLFKVGMGHDIGKFFAIQGIVSLFMPTLIGIIADRWVPAQKMLGICHLLAAVFMALAGYMGMKYGETITNCITRCRMDQAKELIKDENNKLEVISFTVGYDDYNYFSRVFRRLEGVSPSEYRRNLG